MKKIFLLLILSIIVFVIYEIFLDRRVKYLYIGNNNYERYNQIIKEYHNPKEYNTYIRDDDYRTMDLLNEIENNNVINKRTIQNLLIKSNIIVISIGINDLEYKEKLNYKYVDEFIMDIENLFNILRKYNKDKIYFLGYYNKNEYYEYINDEIKKLCRIKNIIYIDIEQPIYKQLY